MPWGSARDLSICIINDEHCPNMQVGMDQNSPNSDSKDMLSRLPNRKTDGGHRYHL